MKSASGIYTDSRQTDRQTDNTQTSTNKHKQTNKHSPHGNDW